MIIGGDWLTRAETQSVCSMLTKGGHQALLVGGCVRNALLGAPVTDIDIATDALPEEVLALTGPAGLRAVPTGIDHGTITVIAGGIPHEITTFRRDVATDGRHATVSFSATLAEDAARRDFTMNALYSQPDGVLVDPLGGLADLTAHRVRFVGDPNARITEDYLRILRFFRFQAWYGDPAGGIDAEGLAACAAHADGLAGLARERVGAEMRKLLSAPDPAPAIAAMAATGILHRILPGSDHSALALLIHLETSAPDWLRRLAALGGPDAAHALRLSRSEERILAQLRTGIASTMPAGELAYRHGSESARDILLLRAALTQSPLPDGWSKDVATGAVARFPVSAADLMPQLAGPALGDRLAELERRWIASGFRLTRDELLG